MLIRCADTGWSRCTLLPLISKPRSQADLPTHNATQSDGDAAALKSCKPKEETLPEMTELWNLKIKEPQVFFTICAELSRRPSRGSRQILSNVEKDENAKNEI